MCRHIVDVVAALHIVVVVVRHTHPDVVHIDAFAMHTLEVEAEQKAVAVDANVLLVLRFVFVFDCGCGYECS